MKQNIPIEARFWLRVDKTSSPNGCWLWMGSLFFQGYGQVNWHGRMLKTHRKAYELVKGPIPKGLSVLHNCPGGDNRACCNPDHLWLGTHKQNMDDMVAKGRQAVGKRQGFHTHPESRLIGEKNGKCKLTAKDVLKIRELYKTGKFRFKAQLAREFGITATHVNYIVDRKTWRHI